MKPITESSLSDSINKLAKDKAWSYCREIESAIDALMIKLSRPTSHGWGPLATAVHTIVGHRATQPTNGSSRYYAEIPAGVEDYFRKQILDEILTKLPLIGDLQLLREEDERMRERAEDESSHT